MQATFPSGNAQIRIHQVEPAMRAPHPALILLHGAGGNTTFWLESVAPVLRGLGIALYAPHYFDRTGTQRATPGLLADGVHVPRWLETLADCLSYVHTRPGVDENRIALLGISLGAFLSLAHAAARPQGIRAIVEVSGGLVEPYASLATSAFPPTLIVHGDRDDVVPVTQARHLEDQLTRLKVPHELCILAGEGHWFSSGAQLRILGDVAHFFRLYL